MSKTGLMHYFSKGIAPDASSSHRELLGIQGNYLLELARQKLPVCPGIIIDSELCKKIHEGYDFKPLFTELLKKLEKSVGRQLGNPDNPLFLKAFQSTNIHFLKLLSIDHIGLCNKTAAGLARGTGETFAYSTYKDYLKQLGVKLYNIPESDFNDMAGSLSQSDKVEDIQTILELYRDLLEDKLPADHLDQLESIIQKTVASFYSIRENLGANLSLIIQARVYGEYIDNSLSGWFFTRDNLSGEDRVTGKFSQKTSDKSSDTHRDIQSLDPTFLRPLSDMAKLMEQRLIKIMKLNFVVERDVLWITSLDDCLTLTNKAELTMLLDLHKQNLIDDKRVLKTITVDHFQELLLPSIDSREAKVVKGLKGGVGHSPGAVSGRIFFSTDSLIQQYYNDKQMGITPKLILCVRQTNASDLRAMDLSSAIITTEGNSSSHSAIISRALNKVSLTHSQIKLTNSGFTLGKKKVKEGDWLSIDVQRDSKPIIYFGPLPLTISDPAKNGLIDLIRLTRPYLSKIEIRANILQETDSQYASLFSASGTGFCDTSYMFLKDSGIYLLRKILFAVNQDIKLLALDELSTLLENEFYNLMKDSEDQTIAPELLNVPLGDFIPKNTELLSELKKRLQEEMPDLTDTDFDRTCLELSQSGAGKDLRGARLAITQPDFFQIQIKALFRAAARRLQEGKTFIPPEIIIPMVMDKRELKTLRFGKMINGIEIPGIQTLADQISQEAGIDHIPHRVGLKIDMPSAALQARNMAQYADFLLFDPDSLTEKVFSLSQENAKDWLFHYSNLDILPDTLFTQLRDEIKDLITHAISGARMIRPDINIGILTQKENPWDILSFALDQNLDFISCPVKSLPIYQCLMARKQIQEKDTNSNSGIS